MIIASLIWLFNRYVTPKTGIDIRPLLKPLKKASILLILLPCTPFRLYAQEQLYNYTISRNGNAIGSMQLSRKTVGIDTYFTITSKVKTRFVVGINVNTTDQARFNNGTLVYSNVFRTVNGNEKEAKRTRLVNNRYEIQSGRSSATSITGPINYNMMMLYLKEPAGILKVYSDNFQQFIAVNKLATHSYRLNLPDGNYNDYHFQNGICSKVLIHHSLYDIKIELTNSHTNS
jgi:hypothetical protein